MSIRVLNKKFKIIIIVIIESTSMISKSSEMIINLWPLQCVVGAADCRSHHRRYPITIIAWRKSSIFQVKTQFFWAIIRISGDAPPSSYRHGCLSLPCTVGYQREISRMRRGHIFWTNQKTQVHCSHLMLQFANMTTLSLMICRMCHATCWTLS